MIKIHVRRFFPVDVNPDVSVRTFACNRCRWLCSCLQGKLVGCFVGRQTRCSHWRVCAYLVLLILMVVGMQDHHLRFGRQATHICPRLVPLIVSWFHSYVDWIIHTRRPGRLPESRLVGFDLLTLTREVHEWRVGLGTSCILYNWFIGCCASVVAPCGMDRFEPCEPVSFDAPEEHGRHLVRIPDPSAGR